MDPDNAPHLRDINEPCYGCGATWEYDSTYHPETKTVMHHTQPCLYLEALEYGGTTELRREEDD